MKCDYCDSTDSIISFTDRAEQKPDISICPDCYENGIEPRLNEGLSSRSHLQAVSNIIELKPDKKYLLVFKGGHIPLSSVDMLQERLATMGISSLSVMTDDGIELEVIEVPV